MNIKLDALVAEKVMGWRIVFVIQGEEDDPAWGTPEGRKSFHPSTDLNDALRALEHVADGWDVLRISKKWTDQSKCFCVRTGIVSGYADTLAMAMCLCALRASGCSEAEIEEALK